MGSPRDGIPYNSFNANSVDELSNALQNVFTDILRSASSGATVSALASRYQAASVVLQPAFYPEYTTREGLSIRWLGTFRGYWVDPGQELREDTVMDRILVLLGPYRDKVFRFFFDSNRQVRVALFDADPDQSPSVCSSPQIKNYIELRPTLQFDCRLAVTSKDNRRIFFNNNGTLTPFNTSNWFTIRQAFSAVDSSLTQQQTECVIEYLRGDYDYTWNCTSYVMRKRVFDVSQICYNYGQGSRVPWKLGPIVYSTPTVASNQPLNPKYSLVYNDETYVQYYLSSQYRNRRSVAFVASNIGMVHFFRIGHMRERGETWSPVDIVDSPNTTSNSQVEREEFAFIPQNALPYMLWYGREDYCSANRGYIPIVDYRLEVFDASFDRNDNPNGNKSVNSWNTYLFGSMGIGGKRLGNYSSSVFLLKLTGYLNDNTGNTLPELMWEVRLDDGALATSYPALVRIGDRNKNGMWYFILGSGPTDPNADSFDKFLPNPKLYVINARNGQVHRIDLSPLINSQRVRAAVGDVIGFDLDNDYQDDVVYFGMYGYGCSLLDANGRCVGQVTQWGALYRIALKTENGYKDPSTLTVNDIKKVIELEDFATQGHVPPIFARVSATKDELNRLWVYFNTGLYLSPSHRNPPYRNYIVGLMDPCWDEANNRFSSGCSRVVRRNELADANNVVGYAGLNQSRCDSSVLRFTTSERKQVCQCSETGCAMREVVVNTNAQTDNCVVSEGRRGWFYELPNGHLAYSAPVVSFGVVISIHFKASDDPCTPVGETFVSALRYNSGLPPSRPPLVATDSVSGNTLNRYINLGYGSPPLGEAFRFVRDTASSGRIIGQTSTGAIFNVEQQLSQHSGRFVLWIEK